MLLTNSDLKDKFAERLVSATSVSVAVAWVTSVALAEQIAAAGNKKKVRLLVGVTDCFTSPEALTVLLKSKCELLIAPEHPKFHAKVFVFGNEGKDVCWVGSANLTDSGFSNNVEVVHEFESLDVRKWFDSAWSWGNSVDQKWIDDYKERCAYAQSANPIVNIPPFPKQPNPYESWGAYFKAIVRAHTEMAKKGGDYGVFSGRNSYLHVLRVVEPIMRKPWESLSEEEIAILLGLHNDGFDYGPLGSMEVAGNAKKVFKQSSSTRSEIKAALDEVRNAQVGLVDVPTFAQKAFERIRRHGINVGVATRLLALARPDVFVSVNKKSKKRLANESGLSIAEIEQPSGYKKLIAWLLKSPWWTTSEPTGGGWESACWQYRAALIDVLVREDITEVET
jgi:HKD family nuclease